MFQGLAIFSPAESGVIMNVSFTKYISIAVLSLIFVSASSLATQHHSQRLDIFETAVADPSLTTLVTAIKAARLVDTLKGKGPFTLFAPSNGAFVKISEGTIGDLLRVENKEKLVATLTYHVVAGKLMAADLVKLNKAKTVQGGEIVIDTSDGVKINNATVIKTDIMTSNGVIHIIDTVVLPDM
ncbi:MAG: putative surface protein with fasciclin (FAS1) repeats [Psychroserpens sp.]